jgi:hypothetical protein
MIASPYRELMTTQLDPTLDRLAHEIAANGISNYESDIAGVVTRLRQVGQTGSLISVLADRAAPSIVRERAFGTLVGQLARGPAQRSAA